VQTSTAGLVERAWIDGGRDSTGYLSGGCWDRDRGFWDVVLDADGKPYPSYVSLDPSQGDGFWAFELWQVHPATKVRYLLFGDRGRYNVRDVLWLKNGAFGGVLEDIVFKAAVLGARPSAVVVEENAARHWLQTTVFDLWQRKWSDVLIVAFHTQKNRNDAAIGVAALLQPAYRNGEARLPQAGLESRNYTRAKVEELTKRRPRTDDTIFADWVGLASLDRILDHTRRPGPAPNVNVKLPPYLARQRRESKPPPRRLPAPLGSYGGAQPLGGPPFFDRFNRTPEIARDGGLAMPLEDDR
jgi:hypothetical protein